MEGGVCIDSHVSLLGNNLKSFVTFYCKNEYHKLIISAVIGLRDFLPLT